MDFPSFADTEGNVKYGVACHSYLSGQADGEACASVLRPIGHIAYFTMPRFFTNNEVDYNYALFAQNLLCFSVAIFALRGIVESAPYLNSAQRGIANFVVLGLAILLFSGHVPVALSDLPSVSFALCATWTASRIASRKPETFFGELRLVFFGSVLSAAAGTMKQSYFVYGGIAIITALLISGALRRHNFGRLALIGCVGLLGASLILVQFWYSARSGGPFWFYDMAKVAEGYGGSWVYPHTQLVAYTLPAPGAYMLNAGDTPVWEWWLYKWFISAFGNEISVYHGFPPHSEMVLTSASVLTPRNIAALLLVTASLGVGVWRSSVTLLLAIVYIVSTIFMLQQFHIELRFYLFQKAVLYTLWAILTVDLLGVVARQSAGRRGRHSQ